MNRNNLPLGMQFRTCEKFWESADSSPALSQNFSQIQKPHRKSFDCDSQSESPTKQTQIAESALDSANQNNPSLRANPQDLRGNPPCEKTQNLQNRLPRSHSLAHNDDYFPLDSANPQNLDKKNLARSANPRKSFCYFWLIPKVESPLPLNPNLPNNADSANPQNLGKNSEKIAESNLDSANQANNPKFRSIIVGASGLSLGISIVVAILLGVGAGILMQRIFNVAWVLFLGVFWGIAAAVLNVYKVYKAELRDFENLANEPKYKY